MNKRRCDICRHTDHPCRNQARHDVQDPSARDLEFFVCDEHARSMVRDGYELTSNTIDPCASCGGIVVHSAGCDQ
jgi:hypothetical protein